MLHKSKPILKLRNFASYNYLLGLLEKRYITQLLYVLLLYNLKISLYSEFVTGGGISRVCIKSNETTFGKICVEYIATNNKKSSI